MTRRDLGPQRTASVDAYLRGTRVLALLAVLALVGGVVSDLVDPSFWLGHGLIAGVVSSAIVVMLSGAILNEGFERRRRRRWSVLAQYVMFELVRNARLIWTSVLELAGVLPPDAMPAVIAESGPAIVQDDVGLAAALAGVVADPSRRQALHDGIAWSVAHCDELLGRWGAVMLNADIYAEIIDRHVELASNLAWLGSLLDSASPPDDSKRHRRARASPAVQIEGEISGDALIGRLVKIVQLAEQLDRGTLELALRIVPMSWWEARMGTTVPARTPVPASGK
jgi:hypothetical protein